MFPCALCGYKLLRALPTSSPATTPAPCSRTHPKARTAPWLLNKGPRLSYPARSSPPCPAVLRAGKIIRGMCRNLRAALDRVVVKRQALARLALRASQRIRKAVQRSLVRSQQHFVSVLGAMHVPRSQLARQTVSFPVKQQQRVVSRSIQNPRCRHSARVLRRPGFQCCPYPAPPAEVNPWPPPSPAVPD